MSRSFALAALLLGFVCVGVLARVEAQYQGDPEATDIFEFWGEQPFALSEASSANAQRQPASAVEHFDGDADDVFFDYQADEEQEFEEEEDANVMPCDMEVSDEEALSMEGDLERIRFTISDDEPVFIVSSRPMSMGPVIATPFGAMMRQLAIDPVQEWMDRQMRVAQEMELLPTILMVVEDDEEADYGRDGARYYEQDYEQDYDEAAKEQEEAASLESLSRLRLGPAMSDLMAGSDRKASQAQSGYTDDGARWTSSQGLSRDGSSQWYSFSMSYGDENKQQRQQTPQMMSSRQVTESQEEEDYEDELQAMENNYGNSDFNDGEEDWSSWMETWSNGTPFTKQAFKAVQKRNHVRYAIVAGLIAGPIVAMIGFFVYRARTAAAAAAEGTITSVQEPLLAPVSPSDHAEPYLVVAADHADLEKHYVNIKYVPLNGE